MGRSIWVSTSNAYIGSAHSHASVGISVIHGGGDNNVVKFIITSPPPNNNGPIYTHVDKDDNSDGKTNDQVYNNDTEEDNVTMNALGNDDSKDDVDIVTVVPKLVPHEEDAANEIVEIVSIDSQPVTATSGCSNTIQTFSTLLATFSLLCHHFR